jgi:regulator of RNase E activity RraB
MSGGNRRKGPPILVSRHYAAKLPTLLFMGIFSFLFSGSSAAPGNVETKRETVQRQAKDRQTIKVLQNAGSNLFKLHILEHHFVTYERARADAGVADPLSTGYKVSEISTLNDESGQPYFFFDLIKAVVPEEKTIFSESLRMTTLGKKHGILYDGWGCEVET